MGTEATPPWRDDTPMLIPMVNEILTLGGLSPGRAARLRVQLTDFSDALFYLAGGLAAATLEREGLLPPLDEPFIPDESDPAPIDPEVEQ